MEECSSTQNPRSRLHINLHTGKQCRQQVDECLEPQADALFHVCDSLLSSPHAHALPELLSCALFRADVARQLCGTGRWEDPCREVANPVCAQRAGPMARRGSDLARGRCHPGGTARSRNQQGSWLHPHLAAARGGQTHQKWISALGGGTAARTGEELDPTTGFPADQP